MGDHRIDLQADVRTLEDLMVRASHIDSVHISEDNENKRIEEAGRRVAGGPLTQRQAEILRTNAARAGLEAATEQLAQYLRREPERKKRKAPAMEDVIYKSLCPRHWWRTEPGGMIGSIRVVGAAI
eukprot:scaffold2668_cov174-Pinguiococcus_pyrenoidosus.AAC.2